MPALPEHGRSGEPGALFWDRALIEAAMHDAGIVGGRRRSGLRGDGRSGSRRSGSGRGGLRRDRRRRRRLSPRGLRGRVWRGLKDRRRGSGSRAIRSGRRRLVLIGLAVGDELTITRRTRPRRHVVRHAARPMRPMIGNESGEPVLRRVAGARCERQSGTEYDRRRGDPACAVSAAYRLASRLCGTVRCPHRLPFAASPDRTVVR